MQRPLCLLVAAALVLSAPGPTAYAALSAAARASRVRTVRAVPLAPTAVSALHLPGLSLSAPRLNLNVNPSANLISPAPLSVGHTLLQPESALKHKPSQEVIPRSAVQQTAQAIPPLLNHPQVSGRLQTTPSTLTTPQAAAAHLYPGGPQALQGRFNELRAAFANKADAAVTPAGVRASGLSSFAVRDDPVGFHTPEGDFSGLDSEPTIPASKATPPGKRSLSLGRAALTFIGFYAILQAGVYAFRTAMPIVIQQAAGSFQAIAHMSLLFAGATIGGRQTAPWAIEKIGLKSTFVYANVARAALIGALAWGLAAGWASAPVILALHTAYGFFYGTSITASEAIATALVGRHQGRLERYWTVLSTLNQVVGIIMPIAAGAAVASWGFIPAILALPIAIAIALLGIGTVLIPTKNAAIVHAQAAAKSQDKISWVQRMLHGAKLVMSHAVLRNAFFAYALIMVWTPLFFFLLAPAYGLAVAGGSGILATAVAGWLTGLFGAGGLIGGIYIMWQQRHFKKKGLANEARLRRSLLTWITLSIVGLAALATLALPAPMFSSLFALPQWLSWTGPLTPAALAILPFGATQTIVALKLRSYFQSRVPSQRDMPDATSFYGSAGLAVGMVILWALSFVFEAFTGLTPFAVIGVLLIPVSLLALLVRSRLAKAE
jgi:hypothetical protein